MINRKAFTTGAMTVSLAFAVWTLAVDFSPISSDFQAGDEVSAAEFNQLFADIDANFGETASALDEKVDTTGGAMTGTLEITGDTGSPNFLADGPNGALEVENTNPDGISAYIEADSTSPALYVKNTTGPLITATNGASGLRVANDGSVEISNGADTTISLDSASGDITLAGAVRNPDGNMLTPIAYGVIDSDGTVLSGTNNFSTSHTGTGNYSISIDGETYHLADYATVATGIGGNFSSTSSAGGNLLIDLFDENGAPQDGRFSFVTYKP